MTTGIVTARDAALSLLQSAANEYAKRTAPSGGLTLPTQHEMVAAAARLAARSGGHTDRLPALSSLAGDAGHCAELGLAVIRARLSGNPVAIAAAGELLKFSTCDLGWVEVITDYEAFIAANGLHADIAAYRRYVNLGDFVLQPIPSNARIAIVGDWGTGTSSALDVMRSIGAKNPDILIHLGDIYYSGTAAECRDNFLTPIDQILQAGRVKAVRIYSLSGNHDMYTGGNAYYDMISAIGQQSSYFALRSEDGAWQFLAMDTGYSDHDPFNVKDVRVALTRQEETWHLDKIVGFSGSTILLSHHQLFSSYAAIGPADQDGRRLPHNPNLLASLHKFQTTNPIAAWFWGHEHSMTLYRPYLGLSAGRCLGHGAVPVTAADGPYAARTDLTEIPPAFDNPRMPVVGGLHAHGYAILTLGGEGGTVRADYYSMGQPDAPIFSERIGPTASTA